jgi:hypothetical protein
MIDPAISGQICVTVKEFGEAMAGAQAQIINASGQAMIAFFFIGLFMGVMIASGFWYFKNQIDEKERIAKRPGS